MDRARTFRTRALLAPVLPATVAALAAAGCTPPAITPADTEERSASMQASPPAVTATTEASAQAGPLDVPTRTSTPQLQPPDLAAVPGLDAQDLVVGSDWWTAQLDEETLGFAHDSSVVSSAGRELLAALVPSIDCDGHVQVIGHSSSDGDPAHNEQLSRRRARSVAKSLREHLPDDCRVPISTHGLGSCEPIKSNGTAAGRAANRRVEITVRATPPTDDPICTQGDATHG